MDNLSMRTRQTHKETNPETFVSGPVSKMLNSYAMKNLFAIYKKNNDNNFGPWLKTLRPEGLSKGVLT